MYARVRGALAALVVLVLLLVFGRVHVKGGRTSARAGEVGRSDSHLDSDLHPHRLNLRVKVPHAPVFVFGTVLVGADGTYASCDRGMEG